MQKSLLLAAIAAAVLAACSKPAPTPAPAAKPAAQAAAKPARSFPSIYENKAAAKAVAEMEAVMKELAEVAPTLRPRGQGQGQAPMDLSPLLQRHTVAQAELQKLLADPEAAAAATREIVTHLQPNQRGAYHFALNQARRRPPAAAPSGAKAS